LTDAPTLAPIDSVRSALAKMQDVNMDRAAVINAGRIVGMFQTGDVLRLEQILDTLDEAERRGLGS
ncbi:MAG TPA: hypothetical protein VGW79_00845, partial [Actinomycetota bacterium]|nr:hypothetical protein [Actinomycetota bacterium]